VKRKRVSNDRLLVLLLLSRKPPYGRRKMLKRSIIISETRDRYNRIIYTARPDRVKRKNHAVFGELNNPGPAVFNDHRRLYRWSYVHLQRAFFSSTTVSRACNLTGRVTPKNRFRLSSSVGELDERDYLLPPPNSSGISPC